MNTFYVSLDKPERCSEALATLRDAAGADATIDVREASGELRPSPMVVVRLQDGRGANALAMRGLMNAPQKTMPFHFVGAGTFQPSKTYSTIAGEW
jgi:hypothetical protein